MLIGDPRLLAETVDIDGGGRPVSLFYVTRGVKPEQMDLLEGAGSECIPSTTSRTVRSPRSCAVQSTHSLRP